MTSRTVLSKNANVIIRDQDRNLPYGDAVSLQFNQKNTIHCFKCFTFQMDSTNNGTCFLLPIIFILLWLCYIYIYFFFFGGVWGEGVGKCRKRRAHASCSFVPCTWTFEWNIMVRQTRANSNVRKPMYDPWMVLYISLWLKIVYRLKGTYLSRLTV